MIKEQIEIESDDSALKASADAADHLADALDHAAASADKASASVGKIKPPEVPDLVVPAKAPASAPVAAHAGTPALKGPDEAVTSDQKKHADDTIKAEKATTKAAETAAKKKGDADKKLEAQRKAGKAAADKRLKADKAQLKEIGGAIKSVGALALTAAAVGVGGLIGAMKGIGDVKIKRDNIRAALDQVTRGRGAQAFGKLDALARSLGKTTEDVADQFIALRKRGIDNVNSGKLIKLRADLEAVGVSSDVADMAIGKVTDAIQRGQGADASIAAIAKRYGAVGDGSNAAAKSAYTVEGAFNRVSRIIEDVVGKLADELGPSITEVVNAFTSGLGEIDPQTLKNALDNVKHAMHNIAPVAKQAAKAIGTLLEVFNATADFVSGKGVAFDALRESVSGVGSAFQTVADVASGAFQGVADGITGAITGITDALSAGITGAVTKARTYVAQFVQLGKDFVQGLADGIVSGLPGLDKAAGDAASRVEAAQRKQLDSHSPSRKAIAIGADYVAGLEIGLDRTPKTDAIDAAFAPANDNRQAFGHGAPAQAQAFAQGRSISVVVNVNVSDTNASPQQIGRASAAAVEAVLRRIEAA